MMTTTYNEAISHLMHYKSTLRRKRVHMLVSTPGSFKKKHKKSVESEYFICLFLTRMISS